LFKKLNSLPTRK